MVGRTPRANDFRTEFGCCCEDPGRECIYKDVVVVGNGPSGISLSYILAGHWPFYTGGHPDEFLDARLRSSPASLVQLKLPMVTEGLEGRSRNPVSLLFDALNHPDADLGMELPSLLKWRHLQERKIDHVVLGEGRPGGLWQALDGNILTISLGCWMELPGLNFRSWEASKNAKSTSPVTGGGVTSSREHRVTVSSVASYYQEYVDKQGMNPFFRSGCRVLKIVPPDMGPCKRRKSSDIPSLKSLHFDCCYCCNTNVKKETSDWTLFEEEVTERDGIDDICMSSNFLETTKKRAKCCRHCRELWKVQGVEEDQETGAIKTFTYLTKNVILATGCADVPNTLDVPGEELPFVLHTLRELEAVISSGHLNADSDPVMIVGAGLSAADAIIAARFNGIPIVHAFRRSANSTSLVFNQLPHNMYPEYHKVHQMMRDGGTNYDRYQALQEHKVLRVFPNKKVHVSGKDSSGIVRVSYVVALLGARPDLSFLPAGGLGLGRCPSQHVDCKRNPFYVDSFTHECIRQPGLFALGPLVGDNFVRFIQGGALAVANHLHKSTPHVDIQSLDDEVEASALSDQPEL